MAYEPIICASIVAAERHGKTDFLWTLPTPAVVFHIDPNTEENFEKAVREKRIRRKDFDLRQVNYPNTLGSRDEIQSQAETIWDEEVATPLTEAIEDSNIRGIGIDTGTEMFDLKLMADHGKNIQILPEMRTATNYAFKGFLNALRRSKKHVVILHRSRAHYEDREKETNRGTEIVRDAVDGVFEREGFNRTGFHVNVEAYLIRHPERSENVSAQFGMRIANCTARPSLATARPDSKRFWNLKSKSWQWGREKLQDGSRLRRASFQYLAVQMYPDTSYDDWR